MTQYTNRVSTKSCVYARYLCVQAGVKFVLGDPQGKFESLITENNRREKKVAGIKTCDGTRHFGDLIIMAGKRTTKAHNMHLD